MSATPAAKMAAPAPQPSVGQNDYDKEIKDVADYVHNYKIDSDLAVCSILELVLEWKILI